MIIRAIAALALAAALPGVAELSGLWTGAAISHPWWSTSAVGRGIAIGVIVGAICLWLQARTASGRGTVMILTALALVLLAAATWYGRLTFVGSEEYIPWAGQLWHFGFIGLIAALIALISLVFSRFLAGRAQPAP